MNPIEVGDFFSPDLSQNLDAIVSNLEKLLGRVETAMTGVVDKAKQLETELKNTKGSEPISPKASTEVQALNDEFKKLLNTYGIYKTEISQVTNLQRDQNQIVKLQKQYAESAEGSYNKLSAEYRLLKIVMNELGTEGEAQVELLEKLMQRTADLYSTMNEYQKSTGKYTLQVGNYERALNGLSISTQQVLREMPTLANSLQQFFIAISNNVPIFVDNLKAVKKETGSWAIAMKGVLTSLFSWQTALLVVLTILPKLAKSIRDKKKAQEEANKETKKAIEYATLLANAEKSVGEARINATVKLKTLYDISQDVTRSYEERIKAAEALKKEYKDELQNVSALAIANGEAKAPIDALTNSLVAQATAKAYLNEITDLTIKLYNLEMDRAAAQAKQTAEQARLDQLLIEKQAAAAQAISDVQIYGQTQAATAALVNKTTDAVTKQAKAVEDAKAEYIGFDAQMQDVENSISELKKRIKAEDLFSEETIGGSFKSALDELGDYYFDWLESKAKILKNEEDKDLALSDIGYERQIANAKKRLEEERATGKLSEQQEKYQLNIINNLYEEKLQARNAIIAKWVTKLGEELSKKYTEVVVDERVADDFVSIFDKLRSEVADAGDDMIASLDRIREQLSSGSFREARKETAIFQDAAKKKLAAERELQIALLDMRRETTGMTEAEYRIELQKIETQYNKAIDKLGKTPRRQKFSIWTVLFGDKKVDSETGKVYKELSSEQQAFTRDVESAFSTAISYANEWMQARIEMANVAVEAAQREVDSAKTALDYEMEARANGYANNVDLARKEYEDKLALQKEAIKEQERLQKQQEAINTATQVSSLITATAELWAAHAKIPFAGTALAIAATAAMWGSFAAAKIQAAQMTATKYGEGMSEYLDYGGSHASGNDIDFGADKHGRRRRVERGEMIGVINKRNVEKYGVNTISGIIDSLNKGTFEKKFALADVIAPEMNAELYHLAFAGLERGGTDLDRVETSLQTLVEQGETKVVTTPYGRIEYRGNNTRIIRNS